jgi:hypothetical protein
MHQLRNRLLRTGIIKTSKHRLLTEADNLRHAVELVLLLRRIGYSRQALSLIRALNRTGDFRQAVGLIRALNRTGDFRQAVGLIRALDRTGKLGETIKLLHTLYLEDNFRFLFPFTPGHFSSPLPDFKEISAREQILFDRSVVECPGIDLREEAQLELLEDFSRYYNDLPFPAQPIESMRYYYDNGWFGYGDAIILYSMLRHYKPRRVVEIGSGFSSAAMLDVNDLFLDGEVHFTFLEPHPKGQKRLLRLLTQEDQAKHAIVREQIQDVPLELFHTLSANDVLFVDSSHVGKVGSDVTHIMFNVLPTLKPGVIIHFHDTYWPFEYPEEYFSWMAWNEAYFLRAFLQYNAAFEIMYFSSFMAQHHADILRQKMPLCLEPFRYPLKGLNPGSSLWIRKVA